MLKLLIKKVKQNIPLLLIIVLASALRFLFIELFPPSLNWDEASHGYNAYSVLKTGRDEWGELMPLIFKSYGDYKLPVYIYLTALSEFFFGLNEFAVRLPSVLAGIGTVVISYFLVLELYGKKGRAIALITSLLVAVEPWSLFISRGGFEANLALFFFVTGMYFFFKFVNSKYANLYILYSAVFLGLTVWTYNSYRIFTPLMLAVLLTMYRRNIADIYHKSSRIIFYSLFVIIVFFIPMFWQFVNVSGIARYQVVKILDQGTISRINEARGMGGSRIVHNKVTYFLSGFADNYVAHFSPKFLFMEGGSHYQFSVQGHGVLYIISSVFLVLGIIFTIKSKNTAGKFILLWLLLAPIPSSLTREAPHVLRAITFLPVPMILTAIGFENLIVNFSFKYRKIIYVLFILSLGTYLLNYINRYVTDYKTNYSWSWQYGYKEVSRYVGEVYNKYDKIIITKKYGEPHEFLLFYLKWDPVNFTKDPRLNRFYQSNWYWVDSFDKFYFVNDWNIPKEEWGEFTLEKGDVVDCPAENNGCLLITSPDNAPKGWSKLKTINFLDGNPAFEIYEN